MKAELQEAIEQLSEALLELKKERLLAMVEESARSTVEQHGGPAEVPGEGGMANHRIPEARPGLMAATAEAATASAHDVESWQRPGSIVRCVRIPNVRNARTHCTVCQDLYCALSQDPLYCMAGSLMYGILGSTVTVCGVPGKRPRLSLRELLQISCKSLGNSPSFHGTVSPASLPNPFLHDVTSLQLLLLPSP